jgi:hypothetical protein
LLADAILATLVMLIPAATSALTQSAVRHAQRHMIAATESGARRRIRLLSAVFARAAFNLIAVYLWLMAASVMAQGVYTWSGSSALTHGLVQSWKLNGFAAALVAAYAAGVRSVLVLQAQSGLAPRLQELRNAIAALPPSAFRRAALPLRAAFLTLLCGAFVDSWVGAIQLFLVVLGIFALRELAQLYATPWSSALARVPLFVRAIVAFLVVYLGVKVLLGATAAAATFFPAELAATLSLVIFALALPGPAQPPPVPLRAVVEA